MYLEILSNDMANSELVEMTTRKGTYIICTSYFGLSGRFVYEYNECTAEGKPIKSRICYTFDELKNEVKKHEIIRYKILHPYHYCVESDL